MHRTLRTTALAVLGTACLLATSSCAKHSYSDQYYLVATNIKLSYWQTANTGLMKAANQYGVKAVEMEASGIADATWVHGAGYLAVRGICDYCDRNQSDAWRMYAAVVAAAYARAVLEKMASAARGLAKPDAARTIADQVLEAAERGARGGSR